DRGDPAIDLKLTDVFNEEVVPLAADLVEALALVGMPVAECTAKRALEPLDAVGRRFTPSERRVVPHRFRERVGLELPYAEVAQIRLDRLPIFLTGVHEVAVARRGSIRTGRVPCGRALQN